MIFQSAGSVSIARHVCSAHSLPLCRVRSSLRLFSTKTPRKKLIDDVYKALKTEEKHKIAVENEKVKRLRIPVFSGTIPRIPEWMVGCWKRKSIVNTNGTTDKDSQVFWVQSACGFYGDLRIPTDRPSKLTMRPKLSEENTWTELEFLADQLADIGTLRIKDESSPTRPLVDFQTKQMFQPVVQYPEPGYLELDASDPTRMTEVPPSESYTEDWRLQDGSRGISASFELLEELFDGIERPFTRTCRGGFMVVAGSHMMFSRRPMSKANMKCHMKEAINYIGHLRKERVCNMLRQDYSYAKLSEKEEEGSERGIFNIEASTLPYREQKQLTFLDPKSWRIVDELTARHEFFVRAQPGKAVLLRQDSLYDDRPVRRLWRVHGLVKPDEKMSGKQ
eukprot:443157_1